MKLGLGHSYDRVRYLPVKLRAYIDLCKPASSVGVGLGYLLGSFYYFAYTGGVDWIGQASTELVSVIYVAVTILLAHSASQALNMAEDADMDRVTPHKEDRPIPAGIVSEDEARSIAWILAAFAIGRGYLVNWRFGVFVTVLLFFGVFYNLDPVRAKSRVISVPWQAVSRGLFMFPAIWAAYGNPLQPLPWILGLFMFFYVLGFQNTADILDRNIDEEYGISTFIVMYGVEGTLWIAVMCIGAMMITVAVGVISGILPPQLLSLLLIVPFCLIMVNYMWSRPYHVSSITGNHVCWHWFYAGMVLIVSIPLVAELLL